MTLVFAPLYSDSISMSSSADEGFRPRMDSYQPTEILKRNKKEEELAYSTESGKVESINYIPVGEIPSFDNPVYESGPTFASNVDKSDPLYEDIKDINLDQYKVPKHISENPYEFS